MSTCTCGRFDATLAFQHWPECAAYRPRLGSVDDLVETSA